jgi:hypothetical protein
MFAAPGVITSLMLVAYELKQSRDVAKAGLTLLVLNNEHSLLLASYDGDAVSNTCDRLDKGKTLSEHEVRNWRRQ